MGKEESSISNNSNACDLNSRTNARNSDEPAWNSRRKNDYGKQTVSNYIIVYFSLSIP